MDFKELGSNLGLEEDEFIEIVELFISTAQTDIDKLKTGYESGNAVQVSEAAHSLKGASGNLGFLEISQIAAVAEKNARVNNLDNLEEIIEALREKLGLINKQL